MQTQDKRNDPRPSVAGRVVGGAVVALALLLITIGIVRVLSREDAAADAQRASAPSPTKAAPDEKITEPSPTPADESTVLARLSFVDLDTGYATPLPRSIRSMPGVQSVQVSPDGSRFVFEAVSGIEGFHQIYVAGVDGSGRRKISHDTLDAIHPSWSPDGTRVLYEVHDEGVGIFAVVVDEPASYTRVTTPATGAFDPMPRFSADGTHVLYTKNERHGFALWSTPVDGGASRRMRSSAAFGAFSPDGSVLAFRKAIDSPGLGTGVSFANGDGSPWSGHQPSSGMVAGFAVELGGSEAPAGVPSWSPNGRRVVYTDPFAARSPLYVFDLDRGRRQTIGRATEASWFDDDTLIALDYQPPHVERVGFLGLAPLDSVPSQPSDGTLMISFEYFCCPGRSMYVYEDGRMIWSEFNIVGPGQKGYFPLPPQGADAWETGYLEQRLTPRGVEILHSTLVSTGLFEEDHAFVKKAEELTIGVRRGGQMVMLHAAKADDPFRATEQQARRIARITRLLKDPDEWLPGEAWADRTIRAFVPARYSVEIHFYSNGSTTPDDPSELPPPADQLLRSADVVTRSWTCQIVRPAEARRIDKALGELTIPFGAPVGVPVMIRSVLPHLSQCRL